MINGQSAPPASVHEANKLLRVLDGTRRKYTARINLPDGQVIEFQTETMVSLHYNDQARGLWIHAGAGDYSSYPVMACPEGVIILCEENPK